MLRSAVLPEQLRKPIFKAPPLRSRNAEELLHERQKAVFRLITAMRRFEDNDAFDGAVAGHRRDFGHDESLLAEDLGGPQRLGETPGQVPRRGHDCDMRDTPLHAELEVAHALVTRAHALQVQHGVLREVVHNRRLVVADGLSDRRRPIERGPQGILTLLEALPFGGARGADDELGLGFHRDLDRHGTPSVERGSFEGTPHDFLPPLAVQVGLQMAPVQEHGPSHNFRHFDSFNLQPDRL